MAKNVGCGLAARPTMHLSYQVGLSRCLSIRERMAARHNARLLLSRQIIALVFLPLSGYPPSKQQRTGPVAKFKAFSQHTTPAFVNTTSIPGLETDHDLSHGASCPLIATFQPSDSRLVSFYLNFSPLRESRSPFRWIRLLYNHHPKRACLPLALGRPLLLQTPHSNVTPERDAYSIPLCSSQNR
jgi:hypothetical protein